MSKLKSHENPARMFLMWKILQMEMGNDFKKNEEGSVRGGFYRGFFFTPPPQKGRGEKCHRPHANNVPLKVEP